MITIETAENGYIVTDTDSKLCIVVEEDEHAPNGEVFADRDLLYTVLELVGGIGSKHDMARVRVVVVGPDGTEIEP